MGALKTLTKAKNFGPKKIQAAVKRVALEEDRSKSLIIFGLPETEENVHAQVSGILLDHVNEKPNFLSFKRIGMDTSERVKLVKLALYSSESQNKLVPS